MEKDKKWDKTEYILRLALLEQLERDPEVLAFLPDDGQGESYEFSPEHERKMKKIFRMARRAERRPQRRRHMARIAACLAVFMVASTVTVFSVEAFRMPVLNFFAEVKEKATNYRLAQEEHTYVTENFREHEPTYAPEGFLVENVSETANAYTIIYSNGTDGRGYIVDFNEKAVSVSLDTEQAEEQHEEINGNKAVVVNKDGKIRVTLFQDTSHITLTGQISWEEAKMVLGSIEK